MKAKGKVVKLSDQQMTMLVRKMGKGGSITHTSWEPNCVRLEYRTERRSEPGAVLAIVVVMAVALAVLLMSGGLR